MANNIELVYQERMFIDRDFPHEAMVQQLSAAAAVMRLERSVALMQEPLTDESDGSETLAGMELAEIQDNNENMKIMPVETVPEDCKIEKPNEYLRFGLRMGFGALLHPYEYIKVLTQLGYEPLPPILSKNFLGRPTMVLPSVQEYMRFIKHRDGLTGLYRGLTSRVIGCTVAALFSESVVNFFGFSRYNRADGKENSFIKYIWNLLRDGIVVFTGLIFSHPFYVISVRQMGQFVGSELTYKGIFGSVYEIVKQDGILGLYAGFMPRLLCDLGVLFVTSTLSAICNRIFRVKSTQKQYNSVIFQFGAILIFYPLQVVAACMACSGSGIEIGAPPFMPVYGHWTDCLMDLVARGDLFRGAFVFCRTLPRLPMHRLNDIFPISRII